ncbi:MAG: ADP-ribosylglycohydrolase family protein [bacterium]|nr:ADP-ribosylglycohydrolase family protein [bacterium]
MLGAIIGDFVGSYYEFNAVKTKDFDLFPVGSKFTDDTILTLATAHAILNKEDYGKSYKNFFWQYPLKNYGERFYAWGKRDDSEPYNSFGNGSAMRVAPVGWAFNIIEQVLEEAKKSAEVTHNHPEGIKGAQAVASAIFLARTGASKKTIKEYIELNFEYDLDRSVDEIRETAVFNETCMISVPEAIICFLDSESFEDALRNAVSLGADADTQACIAGAIAEAFYKEIPDFIREEVLKRLPKKFHGMIDEILTA